MKSKKAFPAYLLTVSAALLFFEYFPISYTENEVLNGMIKIIITRALGSMIFIPLSIYMGYNVFGVTKKNTAKVLLCTLVPLAVVVNNLPIIGIATGAAYVTEPIWYIIPFMAQSFLIGLFEEFAFRGVLLPYVLETRRSSTKSIFAATVISSAAFGAVHILNLLEGAAPGGVILQVGYSFLIGGMCAIVLLYTKSIWICVFLHAVYDFCGYLIPTLGEGVIWDSLTVAITAILGVFALVFMLAWLSKIKPEDVEELYNKTNSASD